MRVLSGFLYRTRNCPRKRSASSMLKKPIVQVYPLASRAVLNSEGWIYCPASQMRILMVSPNEANESAVRAQQH